VDQSNRTSYDHEILTLGCHIDDLEAQNGGGLMNFSQFLDAKHIFALNFWLKLLEID